MSALRVPLLAVSVALSGGALIFALLASRGGRRLPRDRTRRWVVLAAGVATTVAFVEIAEEVAERHLENYDRRIELAVHGLDSPALDAIMRALTFVGSAPVVIAVALFVATWAWRRDRRAARVFLGASVFAELLNLSLKYAFERARPSLFTEIATLHSYSFPSGHSMGSAAIYGAAAVVVSRLRPSTAPWLASLTPILVLGIGTSRVFLGVHWPSDVLAGFSAGASIVVLTILALDRRRILLSAPSARTSSRRTSPRTPRPSASARS